VILGQNGSPNLFQASHSACRIGQATHCRQGVRLDVALNPSLVDI
jgi:hypothetical protein